MTRWKIISLFLAIITALFLSGIGIFIAESNMIGIVICIIGGVMTPGFGFMLRKRLKVD